MVWYNTSQEEAMNRRGRWILAFKWAKMDTKEMGETYRQLIAFAKMYQKKLRLNPHYKKGLFIQEPPNEDIKSS